MARDWSYITWNFWHKPHFPILILVPKHECEVARHHHGYEQLRSYAWRPGQAWGNSDNADLRGCFIEPQVNLSLFHARLAVIYFEPVLP